MDADREKHERCREGDRPLVSGEQCRDEAAGKESQRGVGQIYRCDAECGRRRRGVSAADAFGDEQHADRAERHCDGEPGNDPREQCTDGIHLSILTGFVP